MSTTNTIKELALKGLFVEIETQFDHKKSEKAQTYVLDKLSALAELQRKEEDLSTVSYATPFMLFAIDKSFDSTNICSLGELFNKTGAESDADFDSDSDCGKVTLDDKDVESNSIENDKCDKNTTEPIVNKPKKFQVQKSDKVVQNLKKPPSDEGLSKGNKDSKKESKASKAAEGEKTKTAKKKKDPNAPKGAKGCYMYFMEQFRSNLEPEDASKSVCEIGKLGGEAWRALSDEEKQPFLEQAAQDKERHAAEMASYVPPVSEEAEYSEQETLKPKKAANKGSVSAKKETHSKSAFPAGNKAPKKPFVAVVKKAERDDRRKVVSEDEEEGEEEEKGGEEGEQPSVEEVEGDGDEEEAASPADNSDGAESSSDDGYSKKKRKTNDKKEKREKKASKTDKKRSEKRKLGRSSSRESDRTDSKRHRIESHDGKPAARVKPAERKTVTPPRGIKQCDLGEEHDLLNTDFTPFVTCKFPEDLKLRAEQHVVLVLPPYREFLSQLPANCADEETLETFQQICSSPKTILTGVVKGLRVLPSAEVLMEDEEEAGERAHYTVVTLSVSGHIFEVLHADYSSSLHTTDVFLLDSRKYKDSLKQPCIQVNAQVRRLFQVEDDSGLGEWHEGSVYHVSADFETNPFRSVKVAWLQQEVGTAEWLYSYLQTDCDCSPWDLELSGFVLLEKMKPAGVPRALLVGKLEPAAIITHLKGCDSAVLFKDDITRCDDEFYRALPEEDRLDFHVLGRLCRAGRYSDGNGAGITLLFSDIEKMIRLSKQFNDCNRAFLPWRQAEMMDKTVLALKCALAEAHSLPSLQEAAAEDLQQMSLEMQRDEDCEVV